MPDWSCEVCTLNNKHQAHACGACGSSRIGSASSASAGTAPVLWSCHQCTFRNPAAFEMCKMCSGPRDPVGSSADEVVEIFDFDTGEPHSSSSSIDSVARTQKRQDSMFCTLNVTDALVDAFLHVPPHVSLRRPTTCVASSCDHFSQKGTAGAGWACGYRSLQMLCSGLMRVDAYRHVLFGGCGFVPDVPSLQRWIELAWRLGFDAIGADQMGHKLVGTSKWIGSTEVVALLRMFGIPAQLVAFHSFDSPQIEAALGLTAALAARRQLQQAEADLLRDSGATPDQVLRAWAYDRCGNLKPKKRLTEAEVMDPDGGFSDAAYGSGGTGCYGDSKGAEGIGKPTVSTVNIPFEGAVSEAAVRLFLYRRHSGLLHWLSSYFATSLQPTSAPVTCTGVSGIRATSVPAPTAATGSGGGVGASGSSSAPSSSCNESSVSHSPPLRPLPLYFQHDGHSRALVGFECRLPYAPSGKGASSSSGGTCTATAGSARMDAFYGKRVSPEQPAERGVGVDCKRVCRDDTGGHGCSGAGGSGRSSSGGGGGGAVVDLTSDDDTDVAVGVGGKGGCNEDVFYMGESPRAKGTQSGVSMGTTAGRKRTSAAASSGSASALPSPPDCEISLLLMDPATSTFALSCALKTGKGWEKMVKRGLQTLRKPCYEVISVDPTAPLLVGAAYEAGKDIHEEHFA